MPDNSESRVLRAILELGQASRSVVARHAGVSPATVTSQVRALLDANLITELPATTGVDGVGRPHLPIVLNTRENAVLALHIAATQSTVSVVDIAGRVRRVVRFPHRSSEPRDVIDEAVRHIQRQRSAIPSGVRIRGLGISTGGWVDGDAGTVIHHPFLDWHNVPLRRIVADATGLPTELDGHARGLLHAEQLFGQARESAGTIVLFVGNVIDVAFSLRGEVHYGPRAASGSIGRLLRGLVRHDLGDWALAARAVETGILDGPSLPRLLELGLEPGSSANLLFVERARALGQLNATLLDFLNPESLIISDRSFDLPGVSAAYRDAAHDGSAVGADPIVRTSFAGSVVIAASSAVALRAVYECPSGVRPAAAV